MANANHHSTKISTEQPVTVTSAPFDHQSADVILRSSDNVEFRVFKVILSLASTVFSDMFSLPQASRSKGLPANADEVKDGLVVIPVTEDGKMLKQFLFMCYPKAAVDPPAIPNDLASVEGLLAAAIKYSAERVEKHLREALVSPQFMKTNPLLVFVVACRFRMKEEAEMAARATLPHAILGRAYSTEIASINGGLLFQLLQYHQKCVTAAREALRDSHSMPCVECGERTIHHKEEKHILEDVPREVRESLAYRVPERAEIELAMTNHLGRDRNKPEGFECSDCSNVLTYKQYDVSKYRKRLFDMIDRAVSSVSQFTESNHSYSHSSIVSSLSRCH